MVKQISLDTWSLHHLAELLKKGSNIVEKTNTPIVLYRQTMEEKDDSHEEIICTLVKDNIIEQLVISGGMVVPTFKQQFVFTLEEFPDRLLRKSKDLFLETVELLEDKLKLITTCYDYKLLTLIFFMRLLEYQVKELFKEYGIKVPPSIASKDIERGREDAKKIEYPFVIKAQVPVGGRGKAGGIQKCYNEDELELKYPQVLNMAIKGEKTRAILLEKMTEYEKEIYLSLFLNRSKRCYTVISSAEGGVEIESVKNQVIQEVGLGNVSKKMRKK